jgi:hypothetical protein
LNWRWTAALFGILVILAAFLLLQNQQEAAGEPTPLPTLIPAVSLLPDINIEDVQRLELSHASEDATAAFIQDENGGWARTVPTHTQVISQLMNTQLAGLLNMTAESTLPEDANPLSAYGLDNPTYQISLVAVQDSQAVRFTFLVGNETPTGAGYYLMRQGNPAVRVVSLSAIDNVTNLLDSPPIDDL